MNTLKCWNCGQVYGCVQMDMIYFCQFRKRVCELHCLKGLSYDVRTGICSACLARKKISNERKNYNIVNVKLVLIKGINSKKNFWLFERRRLK